LKGILAAFALLALITGGVRPACAQDSSAEKETATETKPQQPQSPEKAVEEESEEAEGDFSIGFQTVYNSKYVWRGLNTVDDSVHQPSAYVSHGNFTISVWGNQDLTNVNDNRHDFTEIDYTLDYSFQWKCLKASVGSIIYQFPDIAPGTTELYGGVGLDCILSPKVTIYQDVAAVEGQYATFSIGHTFEDVLKPTDSIGVSVDCSAAISFGSDRYNKFYYGSEHYAVTDLLLYLGVPVSIGDYVTLTPFMNFSSIIDHALRGDRKKNDNIFGGVALGVEF